MKTLKQLFCRHDYGFYAKQCNSKFLDLNEPIIAVAKRCPKCDHIKSVEYMTPEELQRRYEVAEEN